ncbi:hypothetical protein NECAME_14829 [Necator americanus]|uniref:Metallothionein n=1 Tax=Necator americanus TaxID=51031 RepID=W2SNE2_NECAM|nr:hypothetical protein NECAME_14829 [Necator americanus]ETN70356.1 hypothetical protein NECAME_14829 [Necator americanus]
MVEGFYNGSAYLYQLLFCPVARMLAGGRRQLKDLRKKKCGCEAGCKCCEGGACQKDCQCCSKGCKCGPNCKCEGDKCCGDEKCCGGEKKCCAEVVN